jgi:hypothetical protein
MTEDADEEVAEGGGEGRQGAEGRGPGAPSRPQGVGGDPTNDPKDNLATSTLPISLL